MARVHAEAHAEGFFFIRHPSTFSVNSSPARVGWGESWEKSSASPIQIGDELLGGLEDAVLSRLKSGVYQLRER